MDQETTVVELKHLIAGFVKSRNWEQFHSAKNLAMSISIEAAELMEHFQWLDVEESKQFMKDHSFKTQVADELADVLIYCISFANQHEIDISEAIRTKMAKNEDRFPAK